MNKYYLSFVCLENDYEYGFTAVCENMERAIEVVKDKLFEALNDSFPTITLILKDLLIITES